MVRGRSTTAKEHTFCCCAIPLLNTGMYLALLEQLAAGILIGTLTLAASPAVGVSIPSFTSFIFAALLYVTSLVQIIGFIGVTRESTRLFRIYTWLNTSLVLLDFALAAALIGVSASQHNNAVNACESDFFPSTTGSGGSTFGGVTTGEGQALCNIFAWVDIGILGGLWLLLAIFQGYLLLIARFYSRDQLADHQKYFSIYSTQDDIQMEGIQPPYNPNPYTGDPWDARPDIDPEALESKESDVGRLSNPYSYTHARQTSDASTIRGDYNTEPFRPQQPMEGVGEYRPPAGSPPPQLPPLGLGQGQGPNQSAWNPVAEQRGIQPGDVPSEMGAYDRRVM